MCTLITGLKTFIVWETGTGSIVLTIVCMSDAFDFSFMIINLTKVYSKMRRVGLITRTHIEKNNKSAAIYQKRLNSRIRMHTIITIGAFELPEQKLIAKKPLLVQC